jgi:hypothetical protein
MTATFMLEFLFSEFIDERIYYVSYKKCKRLHDNINIPRHTSFDEGFDGSDPSNTPTNNKSR